MTTGLEVNERREDRGIECRAPTVQDLFVGHVKRIWLLVGPLVGFLLVLAGFVGGVLRSHDTDIARIDANQQRVLERLSQMDAQTMDFQKTVTSKLDTLLTLAHAHDEKGRVIGGPNR
jgi:hypothetical protein